jgi:hypothetical protein
MPVLVPFILLMASVKTDRTSLLDACGEDGSQVAVLPVGVSLTIRFAVAGEASGCYKVSAALNGRTVEGYLPESAIAGLDEFDQARREGAWLDTSQALGALSNPSKGLGANASAATLAQEASRLIELSQPGRALQLLEREIGKHRDPSLLILAGVAAWRADDPKLALRYWQGSLDLQPNAEVERLLHRVEREVEADRGIDRVYGVRTVLRFDAGAIPAEAAREMVSALDQEFGRIAEHLGCSAEERVVAVALTDAAYRQSTGAAEWSGGQFDGRIRVPLLGKPSMTPALRKVFAHESTHACLSMLGRWPAWLQEGLAQKLSGDSLSATDRDKLAGLTREHKVPKLANLGQDWSRFDAGRAATAYALALAAIETLYENYHEWGVRSLIHSPERLAAVTADLDKRLGL